jgi:hypothetical protein
MRKWSHGEPTHPNWKIPIWLFFLNPSLRNVLWKLLNIWYAFCTQNIKGIDIETPFLIWNYFRQTHTNHFLEIKYLFVPRINPRIWICFGKNQQFFMLFGCLNQYFLDLSYILILFRLRLYLSSSYVKAPTIDYNDSPFTR